METVQNFINGKISESQSKRFSPVFNPATGEQTQQVVLSNEAETEAAITAAENVLYLAH
jgi:malonate-semialdehyde dehydrogenase (acetylating)/methylmalonate-semialdehyde dehydrogenase